MHLIIEGLSLSAWRAHFPRELLAFITFSNARDDQLHLSWYPPVMTVPCRNHNDGLLAPDEGELRHDSGRGPWRVNQTGDFPPAEKLDRPLPFFMGCLGLLVARANVQRFGWYFCRR